MEDAIHRRDAETRRQRRELQAAGFVFLLLSGNYFPQLPALRSLLPQRATPEMDQTATFVSAVLAFSCRSLRFAQRLCGGMATPSFLHHSTTAPSPKLCVRYHYLDGKGWLIAVKVNLGYQRRIIQRILRYF